MPPAVSKSQYRLMQGIANGSIPPKGKLTKAKAAEFISDQSPKGLPERAKALGRLVHKAKSTKGKRFKIG